MPDRTKEKTWGFGCFPASTRATTCAEPSAWGRCACTSAGRASAGGSVRVAGRGMRRAGDTRSTLPVPGTGRAGGDLRAGSRTAHSLVSPTAVGLRRRRSAYLIMCAATSTRRSATSRSGGRRGWTRPQVRGRTGCTNGNGGSRSPKITNRCWRFRGRRSRRSWWRPRGGGRTSCCPARRAPPSCIVWRPDMNLG